MLFEAIMMSCKCIPIYVCVSAVGICVYSFIFNAAENTLVAKNI